MNQDKKEKILIVDDVPTNIKVVGIALKAKYDVVFATNGPDALKIAKTVPPPDLILLDIVMPDMDGFAVCKALQGDDATRNIPIIFITGKNEMEDETRGLELGAADYITKPYNINLVETRVNTHLTLKRYREKLAALGALKTDDG